MTSSRSFTRSTWIALASQMPSEQISGSRLWSAVCVPRTFVSSGRTVPREHVPTSPSGETHEVVFLTTSGQPLVRERVTELMAEDPRHAGTPGPRLERL